MSVPFCRAGLCAALALLTGPARTSAQPRPDPVSGIWSGRIGPAAEPNYAITLELRLDSASVRGTVSTIDGTGEIRSGSYDAPSGTLHLELARAGEQSVSLILDGVAVQGTATGRVTRGQSVGTFVITRKNMLPSGSAAESGTPDRAQLRTAFEELNGSIAKAAGLVPADRFGWRPVETVRTVGQVVGHIADAYLYYCGRAAGHQTPWSDAIAQAPIDKPALIARLNIAAAKCSAAFADGNVGPLVVNYGHASLHYGNLVTYLRLLGLVPPTS